jgi:hypothetical protein
MAVKGFSVTDVGVSQPRFLLRSARVSASGGTVTDIVDGGVAYRVHTFTISGDFVIDSTGPGPFVNLECLVVAGGGGAGGNHSSGWAGGGGGGGGYRTAVLTLGPGSFPTVVGAGGIGGVGGITTVDAGKGGNSSFSTITSTGGGNGGRSTGNGTGLAGATGGSGGGGAGQNGSTNAGGAGNEGLFSPPEGNNGGPSTLNTNNPGGGGGAGGLGPGGSSGGSPTAGGIGAVNTITGTSVTYSAGGGAQQTAPVTSPANSGRGGDARNGVSQSGFAGGSGIVVIRYRT